MAPPPLALTRETPRLRALLKTDEHISARYRAGTRADRPRIKEVIEYVREQLQMRSGIGKAIATVLEPLFVPNGRPSTSPRKGGSR
jgi:hypothetical protein